MELDPTLTEDFEKAAAYLRGIAGKLESNDLLYFYARFKQAKEGPNTTPKPGFFDFQGKQKWQAWSAIGEMPKEQAMEEYIDRLDDLEEDWRKKEPSPTGGSWVSVSTMLPPAEEMQDKDKTLLDHVKEGNCEKFKAVSLSSEELQSLDPESGMALIHWAADRGHVEMVMAIVAAGCDINLADSEGQTALHYAASCGHGDLVQALLKAGADKDKKDSDRMTAGESATEDDIKQLLS